MNDDAKGKIGATFESFLDEQGIKQEVYADATKRVLVWQLMEAMKVKNLTKVKMASLMQTSRTQLDRLLDPDNTSVQLDTMIKAAKAIGRTIMIELI